MGYFILTFIVGAYVGAIIALMWVAALDLRIDKEHYLNKIKELR